MIQALGMMSGTSLDGVDAAMVETDGIRIAGFGRSGYRPFDRAEAAELHKAQGAWPGQPGVARAAEISVAAHAELARRFPEAELIGFHGQTLAHDPKGRGTHQAGDGVALARLTGRMVAWDFRSEDVRQGGEGAPLAPFFHWACARWAVEQGHLPPQPLAFLNLGGVGNITWLDPTVPAPEMAGACLAFDTGPANAPINDLMRQRRDLPHDEDGALAATGRPDRDVIADFLRHPWFQRPPPKSLDRNDFSGLLAAVSRLGDADAAATLVAALAQSVAAGMRWLPSMPARLLVCGGGRRNGAVMAQLQQALPCEVARVEAARFDGDMLEAQAFAWLAVRVRRGLATSGPTTTGVAQPACGGRLSWPRRGRKRG